MEVGISFKNKDGKEGNTAPKEVVWRIRIYFFLVAKE